MLSFLRPVKKPTCKNQQHDLHHKKRSLEEQNILENHTN